MDANVLLAAASLLLFLLLIAYFAFLIYHQGQVEPEEKPVYGVELLRQHYPPGATVEQPTPYWVAPIPSAPDPLEISSNLDRKIIAGGVMLFALAGLVGGYFLLQIVPGSANLRAIGAEKQLETSIHRGKNLYANFCFNCHGKTGQGNGENGADGKPLPGKPLNKPDFKAASLQDDPQKLKDTESYIRLRITRGKPNVPPAYSMPAWGQSDGGPLNDEQVSQLISFIMRGSDDDWADIVNIRAHLEGSPSTEPDPGPPPAALSGADIAAQYCVTCHSVDPNKPSTVPQAPNLGRYGAQGPLNDQLKALKASGDADWLFKWIANAPKIKPGIIMPVWLDTDGGQLKESDIRLLVQYLEGLK
ncbi:MAG TPA: c-type cytochrome [Candidatus Limnocylindria bacterium]|nr:c-type cytochrome [Candidatus Limnocylindria bacterium]